MNEEYNEENNEENDDYIELDEIKDVPNEKADVPEEKEEIIKRQEPAPKAIAHKSETMIYVPDIECESCSKLIGKRFHKMHGIDSFKVNEETVDIVYNPTLVRPEKLVETIKNAGFRASLQPFERKTFKERAHDFRENKNKYKIEYSGILYTLYLFLILAAFEAVAYFGFFRTADFLPRYGWWLFYLNVSIATIAAALWHYFAYKGKVTCMTGMMVGMTIGMQAGMMLGAVFGATNGFFVGSMVGMLIGITIGAWAGCSCGVMGWMQGMMAGLMGGTMGPMISIMMFNDHLLVFMPFYMIVNILILWGFSYMVYEEIVEDKKAKKVPVDFTTLASITLVVAAVLIAIMVYGPKYILFG